MHEKISALIDDELDQSELPGVLSRISEEPGLCLAWQRYHLIRSAVRNEPMVHIPGLAERLEQAVCAEQKPSTPRYRRAPINAKRWVPGLALAASISGLIAFSFFSTVPPRNFPQGGQADVARVDQDTRWETATPELEGALNTLLVEHGEFSEVAGMNGLMSYAKFVSYDTSD